MNNTLTILGALAIGLYLLKKNQGTTTIIASGSAVLPPTGGTSTALPGNAIINPQQGGGGSSDSGGSGGGQSSSPLLQYQWAGGDVFDNLFTDPYFQHKTYTDEHLAPPGVVNVNDLGKTQ